MVPAFFNSNSVAPASKNFEAFDGKVAVLKKIYREYLRVRRNHRMGSRIRLQNDRIPRRTVNVTKVEGAPLAAVVESFRIET
jgi:hypothetical protein